MASTLIKRGLHGLWEEEAALIEQRTAAGAAAFHGTLTVVGGAGSGPTQANRKATAESRKISSGEKGGAFKMAPTMGSPRMSPGVAIAGDALWAVGGW